MTQGTVATRRSFLATHYPDLALALGPEAGPSFQSVAADGVPVDLVIEGRSLFGGDARRLAADQVAAYKAQPLRLHMNRLEDAGLVSPVCIRLVRALNDCLMSEGRDSLSTYPVDSPAFLVVFGLGLGHHLEALAAHTKARWLILVEPALAFFEHSLAVVDWPRLADEFETRGGKIHIVTEADPTKMAEAIVRFVNAQGIAFADGTWLFTHYPFWAFAEARKRLHEAIEFSFVNRGFFEDELRMLGNATANFRTSAFHLLEGKRRLQRPETAVIVGAGPSLDESFETLRRIRDRVVLFSCGTSLRPLLKNGFLPDFHCELENVPHVHDVITEAMDYGDLRRIALIASATVDPRVPPLFGSTIFILRDLVSSTEILGGRFRVLPGVSPTCVNLGLAAAGSIGCTNFVFFGTDCGTRPGAKRHAEGTIYRDVGVWGERDRAKRNLIEVEGNFGGVIATDWIYDSCRLMLAHAIETHRITVINCSDGALIPGARPCAPEALEIEGPAVEPGALLRTLEEGLPRFGPGEFLAAHDFPAIEREAERLFAELDRMLAEAADVPDFAALYARMRDFAGPAGDQYLGTLAIISGTLTALPRIAMFYGFRVADGPLRKVVYDRAVAEIRAIVGEMADGTGALLRNLTAEPVTEAAE